MLVKSMDVLASECEASSGAFWSYRQDVDRSFVIRANMMPASSALATR